MPNDQRPHSATELAECLNSGQLTAVDLVTDCFARIRRHGDSAVFITLTEESALVAAKQSDKRRAEGTPLSPWDGIPVAWKDLVDISQTPTTAASAVYENATPVETSAVIYQNCEKAGLICIGKTNLSEFAYSGLGLNPHFGTPINPYSGDDPLAPGGSSSGSAVAVAAGLVPLAVGTDTAGSVRVPAAFCGLCGFKSSQSHYDKTGVFPLSASLDSIGTFAHCPEDLIAFDQILRGAPVTLPEETSSKPDLIIPENVVFDTIEDDVKACFDQAVGTLSALGYRIVRKPFSIFDEVATLFAKHGTLTVAEAATVHAALLASPEADLMDQRVRERMMTASQFTAQDYITLQWARERLQCMAKEQLGDALLLFPTVAIPAPSISKLEADDDLFVQTNLLALRNTMLGNYLGMPGVSLPIGTTQAGLPVGALFSGAHATDLRVLRSAQAIFADFAQNNPI